jgi:hypothetical protein
VKYVLRTIAIGAALSAALISQAFAQSPAPGKPGPAKAAAPKSGSPKSAPKGAMTGVPRLANGKPDFSGVWQVLNTANWDIEAHGAKPASCLRPGVKDVQGVVVYGPCRNVLALGAIGSVPAGLGIVDGDTIPYTPAALKVRDDNRAHALERDPEVKCYLPGVPRANYMPYPFQIYQTANTMLISYEYDGADRQVKFTDPGPAALDSWMGQSVAKWDGDTLVLTVTGQNDRTWLDRRQPPFRGYEGGRAVHLCQSRRRALRGGDHRSSDLHPSVEDQHEPVQKNREGRHPAPVQVRGVC